MTVESRIKITTGILLLFVLGTVLVLLWSFRQVEDGIKKTETASQAVRSAFMLSVFTNEFLDHGNKRALRQWEKHRELLGQILNEMSSESIDAELLEDLRNSFHAVDSLSPQLMQMASKESNDSHQDRRVKNMLSSLMLLRLEELVKSANDMSKAIQTLTLNRRHLVQNIIVAGGISLVVITLINIHLIRKSVIHPLRVLSSGAEKIGSGDFNQIVGIESDDEVGKLAQVFNGMIQRIEKRELDLKKTRDDLEVRVKERTAEIELTNKKLVLEIEERKRAEQAVEAERQRLYDVLETLPVYVCLLDSDYRMPFANRYFRETFGESLGRRCHDFLFDLTEPCETCETYKVMKTRAAHHWYWTGPNGRDYDVYDFPFIGELGSPLILEMGIDVTERNRAEDALRETLSELTRSNADLRQFAYIASHDLQEPLRNVSSAMQLLEKRYKGQLGSDADQFIKYAVDSVKAMKKLIEDLLAYSRISTKGHQIQMVQVEQVFNGALANLTSAISQSNAQITHDPLPELMADPGQLSQVFQNLVSNAVKFRRQDSPSIHVSAAKDGDKWFFSIKDNGIGIEERHMDRIFLIFQRLHKKTEFEGSGIGLAIAKKIVERHGGRIWVESEFGLGTTFHFTIPVHQESATGVRAS